MGTEKVRVWREKENGESSRISILDPVTVALALRPSQYHRTHMRSVRLDGGWLVADLAKQSRDLFFICSRIIGISVLRAAPNRSLRQLSDHSALALYAANTANTLVYINIRNMAIILVGMGRTGNEDDHRQRGRPSPNHHNVTALYSHTTPWSDMKCVWVRMHVIGSGWLYGRHENIACIDGRAEPWVRWWRWCPNSAANPSPSPVSTSSWLSSSPS